MPITFADRVKETTTTTGTGTITLAGAVTGFQTFFAGVGTSNQTYYLIAGATTEWEVGIGTLATSTTLTRATVLASSNAGALVSFSAGTKNVMAVAPARAVNNARSSKRLVFTAGETIAANQAVYFNPYNQQVYLADADTMRGGRRAFLLGVATEAIASGSTGEVMVAGLMTGMSGLTAGRVQYLSSTSGAITDSPTTTNPVPLGIAVSTTSMLLNSPTQGSCPTVGTRAAPYYGGQCGFMAGGETATTPTLVASAYKVIYATDATTAHAATALSAARYMAAGVGTGNNKGYYIGGGTTAPITTTNLVTYSTESLSTPASAALPAAAREGATISERNVKGYVAGGSTPAGTAVVTGNKVTYASDTTAALTTVNLSAARAAVNGMTDGGRKGYWLGGYSGANVELTTCDMIVFANDTTAARTALVLAATRSHMFAFSDGCVRGWAAGGQSGAAVGATSIYRITFHNDTQSTLTAVLGTGRWGGGSLSEGSTKGYCIGGRSASETTTGEVLKYGPETITATSSSNLGTATGYLGSHGDTGL